MKTIGAAAEIWDSGALVIWIWSTFDLLVFNVILGHLVHLCQKWPDTYKLLAMERNEWNLGIEVIVDHVDGEVFLLMLKVFGAIRRRCLEMACNSLLVSDYVREWHF